MSEFIDPEKLDRLAKAAVYNGVNLQKGQDLIITAQTEALPLVRLIAKHAYQAGGGMVLPFFTDDEISLARLQHADDDSFDKAPKWFFDAMGAAFKAGAARMAIAGADPMVFANEDPAKVSRLAKAASIAGEAAKAPVVGFEINWNIVAYPGAGWAKQVFPDLPVDEAQGKLMDHIFAASRLDGDDPVANLAAHSAELKKRLDWLNDHNFSSLHYSGPGTDLKLGLAEGHIWLGGETMARNGVACQPNIPTEEVFTCPHAYRVDGTVSATKPLAYQGTVIENIVMRFEAGRVVEATATTGQDVLQGLLDTDDGATRIGEVALVPHSSPISQSDVLFYNTLFDENASCHIALGQCYATTIKGGNDLAAEEIKQLGGNQSIVHVDWMMGSDAVDIDGETASGEIVPVMRGGEWAF